jgi:peptidoglycan hydrolase CwlO-like protein
MKKLFLIILLSFLTLYTSPFTLYARTTPDDILREQRDVYNARVKNYSPENQRKLAEFEQKVAAMNKNQTDILEAKMVRQGEILNEYVFRQGIEERQADGISRDLSNPVENARYWVTYAHEAVAFQAAKHYIFDLSGENNIKANINSDINQLANDIDILAGKVDKSQKIIETLINK